MAVTLSSKTKREIAKQIECGKPIPDFYLPLLPGPLLVEIQEQASRCQNQQVLAQLTALLKPTKTASIPKKRQKERTPQPTKLKKRKKGIYSLKSKKRPKGTHRNSSQANAEGNCPN